MKNLMILIIAVVISLPAFSQSPLKLAKARVGNPDILRNWKVGEYKYVNQVKILRLEGENEVEYDFLTNVFYTPESMATDLEEKTEVSLPGENGTVPVTYESAPGGQVSLFFCRPEKGLADPANFNIQVIDESGNAIWSATLETRQPYYYKWEIWYYYKTINIPVSVGENFTIKVEDSATGKSFKFGISLNEETEEPALSVGEKPF